MINRTLLALLIGSILPASLFAQDKGVEFFEAKIRPVLTKHCYECHSAQSKRVRGDLLLVSKKRSIDIEQGRKYWAFQPLSPIVPPAVKNVGWTRTPIDRFILAKLEEKGLTPNGPIARERLLRRAYFDLHGLPPTPAEID